MSTIANVLKNEISRLSKKVVREFIGPIQTATASHRHQLAALKKQVAKLERELGQLRRGSATRATASGEEAGEKTRFVAKGLISLRARLGLSAEDFGQLLDVSAQTIYNWERKNTTPRPAQVAAIAALRKIGKREAQARLASLAEGGAAQE